MILMKGSTDKAGVLQRTIEEIVIKDAKVISKGPQEDFEIRDLDEMTTQVDMLVAL